MCCSPTSEEPLMLSTDRNCGQQQRRKEKFVVNGKDIQNILRNGLSSKKRKGTKREFLDN